jgi:uncharacterized integral membrane protein
MNLTPTGIFILLLTIIYLVIIIMDLLFNFLGFERHIAIGQIVLCLVIIGAVFMLFKRRLR